MAPTPMIMSETSCLPPKRFMIRSCRPKRGNINEDIPMTKKGDPPLSHAEPPRALPPFLPPGESSCPAQSSLSTPLTARVHAMRVPHEVQNFRPGLSGLPQPMQVVAVGATGLGAGAGFLAIGWGGGVRTALRCACGAAGGAVATSVPQEVQNFKFGLRGLPQAGLEQLIGGVLTCRSPVSGGDSRLWPQALQNVCPGFRAV